MDSEYLEFFSKLSYREKSRIIKSGRPTLEIKPIEQHKQKL